MGQDQRLRSRSKVTGQGRRSKVKVQCQNRVLHHCYIALSSRSKVGFKVTDQGQRSMSTSKVEVEVKGQISGAQRSMLGARLCRMQ